MTSSKFSAGDTVPEWIIHGSGRAHFLQFVEVEEHADCFIVRFTEGTKPFVRFGHGDFSADKPIYFEAA